MQNELADNTMLGSKYNREEKYAKMGAEPLKDMLMSMRFRSKDEKFMPRQSKKANELENTITSVADEDGVAELGNILRDASYVC
jgi:hypothetical protein